MPAKNHPSTTPRDFAYNSLISHITLSEDKLQSLKGFFTLLPFYSFSIEHMTLLLLAPRSTNWANWLLDTNLLQTKIFNVMILRKLLKKRK